MELKNERICVGKLGSLFCTWSDDTYEVTVLEFRGFAYIERLDVKKGHQGKGLGTAIVQALKDMYGTVIAAPKDAGSQGFFERIGEEDVCGELMGQSIWTLDQGYGIYIME